MIDSSKVTYGVVCITAEGKSLILTELVSHLGWEEGEKELSMRISLQLANVEYNGGRISDIVQPLTPILIYAQINGVSPEVARGTVQKWSIKETSTSSVLDIECYDEVHALRHNQDEFYFTEGHTTKAIITKILDKWNVPYDYMGPEVKHSKQVFKKQYLCDMITKILKDAKEHGAGNYFMRAIGGRVQILPRGGNEDIYHFDVDYNLVQTSESFDAGSIVTRVLILAKSKDEGHQKVEATVDGKTEYGVRQVIYERPDKTTMEEAEKAAKEILKEQGDIKRKKSIQGPDVPTLRKGDRIRVHDATGTGYFFVKSVRHNAQDMKMTMEVDEDKDFNKANGIEYDTNSGDEIGGSDPP